jgi:tRNA pseudouridine55 synthase
MRIDGLVIADKPEGLTSLRVVQHVKRRFSAEKAGHIGTLDPFATGVLPVVLNEGTKLVPFMPEGPKAYDGVLKLGEETSTDDRTGETVYQKPWEDLTDAKIEEVFQSFLGTIRQIPPMFSAVKMDGKPLYRLARQGIEVERKEREVDIFDVKIKKIDLPEVHFSVSCSKGTYIRSIARDVGRKLGCGAHLLQLRRVRSGPFTIEQAVSWEKLKDASMDPRTASWVIPLKEALFGLPEVIADGQVTRKVRFGMGLSVRDLSHQSLPLFEKGQWLKLSSPDEGLIAILQSEVKKADLEESHSDRIALRPLRIFHPAAPFFS